MYFGDRQIGVLPYANDQAQPQRLRRRPLYGRGARRVGTGSATSAKPGRWNQARTHCRRGNLEEVATIRLSHKGCPQWSLLLNVDIFPSHPNPAAGVDLQGDDAVSEPRRGISVVNNLDAVEAGQDMVAVHRHLDLVPLAGLQNVFALGCGLDQPATTSAFVKPGGMMAHARVDLYLHAFNVRTVLRVDAQNP